jgi:hypothetical protein
VSSEIPEPYPNTCPYTTVRDDKPCILRAGHTEPCQPFRPYSTYTTVVLVEPSDSNSSCSACFRPIRRMWMLRLPDVSMRGGVFTLCRSCASDVARALLSTPAGPAPDPHEF